MVSVLLVAFSATGAQTKPIRLRNQVILPQPAVAHSQANAARPTSPASGLFLIQFSTPLSQETRDQIAAAGIDLLHYVPEDAFVARLRGARLETIRALPFVQWIGEFQPEHKLHPSLRPDNAKDQNELVSVAVLLAPRSAETEIAAGRAAMSSVQQTSRLRAGTIVRGKISRARLAALARSESVLWIEPFRPMKMFDEIASKIVAGDAGPGSLETASLGYDGAGVKVAVADSGLNNGDAASMHPDLFGRTPTFFYYGHLTDAADEHGHGTHVAGIVAGNGATGEVDDNGFLYGLGVAPGASIIAQRIFDADGNFEAPVSGFEQLTRDATRAGADIGSNSWGDDTQGAYDDSALEFDELVRDADALAFGDQPYIVEFSAGNAGPGSQTVGSPAVAKNVIATGACENDRFDFFIYDSGADAMADFSSRGPCADGRIKPDLVTPGTWIASLQSQSAPDINAWAPISPNYQYEGGTSQSGPHASGAAAVFVQYYRQTHGGLTPSPALVKAALINSAVNLDDSFGTPPVPNMDEGWGRIDLTLLLDPALTFDFVDQTNLLSTGQVYERKLVVVDGEEPLKVTLAYTDVPGFPGAAKALVNDLDLEVVAPDGTLYRGNQFQFGESIPNAAQPDSINNVEGVYIAAPLAGLYTVRVRARNVASDSRFDSPAVDQDFALVTAAALAAPGQGVISFDHKAYRVPASIKILVTDTDLAGQPSITVAVTSSTETTPENILLTASGSSGAFTGSVSTATGPAAPDGLLQIANGNVIQASYFDASAGRTRTATALADFVPPVLTAVAFTNGFGQAIISWHSSELASSLVFYGTNQANLNLSVTNLVLETEHEVQLENLVGGRTYYFYVVSSDEAGNTATNNNGGALFSFLAPSPAPLLLIDEYQDPLFGTPPLTGYTQPLNDVGIPYDVWDASVRGAPTLSVLRPYRAVIWRVPELIGVWTAAEQGAISNYLYSGGALFVASMEVLSRLEGSGGTAFIHNVLQVQSYIPDPDSTGAFEIVGSDNETVGNGIDSLMDYTVYENLWAGLLGPDLSDTITPAANASPVFHNDLGDVVGLRWPAVGNQAPGRLVLLTFPLDAVPYGSGADDRVRLLRNALSFLAPGASGNGTVALDSSAYAPPHTVSVEVGDADLAGQGTVSVTATSTTQPVGTSVTLRETAIKGDFIGTFELIDASSPPVAGKVRGKNGDTLTVSYFDASRSRTIAATAAVDTVAPAITNVTAEPDYEQAVVFWDTSEPADALVQFGESAFLNRTAFVPNLATGHAVELPGLLPNKTYYYQVVSRDAAGNTRVDDNQGNLYTFHTLLPLSTPWFDNMNSGATNWSVFSADGSQVEWTLGVPNNGQETSAHSPPKAWGSNLNGDAIDYTETFLISPALYLSGGNVATLRFWHSYDFLSSDFDILNGGQVMVLTNNATTPAVIATYTEDITPGWVEEVLDLSAFMGQVIYLVWDYELFSFDTLPRAGWLVDDVSVTVSNVLGGTVKITNNLWQASYILSGPLVQRGRGQEALITNAPPGTYTLTFGNLPYYITPPAETKILASGGTIQFQGNYTFPDANANGISDLWEQQYFGNVSSNRTRFTDTDGDGMTDYAEFIAGTDPNNPPAPLRLSVMQLSNNVCRLQWASSPGLQHRVHTSTNLTDWTPYSAWMLSTGTVMVFNIPINNSTPRLFCRVETSASASPTQPAPNLRLSLDRLPNSSLRLSWNSTPGRGYQVESSLNAQTWIPLSGWIQATAALTYYTPPPQAQAAPSFFRIQVQP